MRSTLKELTCGDPLASNKCIAGVSRFTLTDSIVIGGCAIGVSATNPRTGIFAFLIDTSLVSGAFCVDHTFWFALNVWIADVVSNTFARGCIVSLLAFSIDATGRGVARLDHLYWSWS